MTTRTTRSTKGKEKVEDTPPKVTPKCRTRYTLPVKMKAVRPVIPDSARERDLLGEELAKMGLRTLITLPWSMQSEDMLKECLGNPVPEPYAGTKRGKPSWWKEQDIAKAFDVPCTGTRVLSRGDNRLAPFFAGQIDEKEGWSVDQCVDKSVRQLMYFLIPILHPEKPKRVTVKLGSTIIACLVDRLQVNWAALILEVMMRQVGNLKGTKGISLSTYLFHMYNELDLLTPSEGVTLRTRLNCIKYIGKEKRIAEEESEESEDDPDVKEVPAPSKRRRLVKKERTEETGDDDPVSDGPDEPDSEPGSQPGSKPRTPRGPTMSDSTLKIFMGLNTDLGALERRMAVMEDNMMKMAAATGVNQANLVDKVIELAQRGDHSKELGMLRAIQTQQDLKLAAAEKKLRAREDEKEELERVLKDTKNQMIGRKEMAGLLNNYLLTLHSATATGAQSLIGSYVFETYLKDAPRNPDVEIVIQIVEDYGLKFKKTMADASEAVEKLRDLYKLIPREETPLYEYHDDVFSEQFDAETKRRAEARHQDGTPSGPVDWAEVARTVQKEMQSTSGEPGLPPGFEKVMVVPGSNPGCEPERKKLQMIPYVEHKEVARMSPGVDIRSSARTGEKPDILVVERTDEQEAGGNSQADVDMHHVG